MFRLLYTEGSSVKDVNFQAFIRFFEHALRELGDVRGLWSRFDGKQVKPPSELHALGRMAFNDKCEAEGHHGKHCLANQNHGISSRSITPRGMHVVHAPVKNWICTGRVL